MDKRKLTEVIVDLYKGLTPQKTAVFVKSDDVVNIRVLSDAFEGMTFSSRFKKLNDIFAAQEPALFKEHLFVFEAFTSAEMLKLPKDPGSDRNLGSADLKQSARPLES